MKKFRVDAENFDGEKFMARYGIGVEDFYAKYENRVMYVYLKDGVTISDETPVFEASDTASRDRIESLTSKLSTSDLTLSEVSELLRKERSL